MRIIMHYRLYTRTRFLNGGCLIGNTIDSRKVEKKKDSDKIIGRLVTANDSYQSARARARCRPSILSRGYVDTLALPARINRHLHV